MLPKLVNLWNDYYVPGAVPVAKDIIMIENKMEGKEKVHSCVELAC